MQQEQEQEKLVICFLRTLAAYISSNCPAELLGIVQSSQLVFIVCSYLRNDSSKSFQSFFYFFLFVNSRLNYFLLFCSVLDIARRVPLYKTLLQLLRSIASCPILLPLLLPNAEGPSSNALSPDAQSIHSLLYKLKNYVSSYTARLA